MWSILLDWTTSATMIIEGSRVVLFNVENTEPECLNSEWTYETGYWVLETLPITFLVSLWFMSHIYHFLRACLCCKKTPKRPRSKKEEEENEQKWFEKRKSI